MKRPAGVMLLNEKKKYLPGLIVALAAFVVYANSLANGFVWDDTNVIVNEPSLRGSAIKLFNAIDSTRDYEKLPYYRPLAKLTFLFEERIHGLLPYFMHLVNALLHALNAFLVFLLAREFTAETKAGLFAALLFAVHPLNSEAVNFLSGGRNTLLAGFFVLTSCLLHYRSVKNSSITSALMGAVFLLAGFLSKETALAGLLFIAALEIPALTKKEPGVRLSSAMRLVPYAIALSCYLLLRWLTLSNLDIQSGILPGMGNQSLEGVYKIPGMSERLLMNVYTIPRYLLNFIWPAALSPIYVLPSNFRPLSVMLVVSWLCLVTLLVWLRFRTRSRASLLGLSWAVIFWLPVSGIIWFPSSPLADRFTYLPVIGLCIAVADQAFRLLNSSAPGRRYGLIIAAFVLIVLSAATIDRNRDWKDDVSLFSKVVEQYPDNPYGHAGLGEAYLYRENRTGGDLDAAEREFEAALALNPAVPGARTKLGYIRLFRGDSEGAVYNYTIALGAYPLDKEALLNRAIALENLGKPMEALQDFRRFLMIPGHEFADARPYAEGRVRELSKSGPI